MSDQLSVPLVQMRGGTSKGLYLHAADVPAPGPARDALLARLMGSPDVLQIDGLGGSRPITSKVALIAPSDAADADVDYTFAQVDIETGLVSYNGNCGNISSGVGPFAVDEKLVPVEEGTTVVRIRNTNTDKVLVAHVPVRDGAARVDGDFAIPGVPGTGAEIVMDWSGTVGAVTGRLLPTGNPLDTVELEDGRTVRLSIVDAGNPIAWVAAADLGITGSEGLELNGRSELVSAIREIRGKVCVRLGLCQEWTQVDTEVPAIPMVGAVAPPGGYSTLNGQAVASDDMDLRARLMFMNRLHESMAGTASISLAAASRLPGTTVHQVATERRPDTVLIGHPSGVMPVRVQAGAGAGAGPVEFRMLGISRTARRLAKGWAYYPRPT